MKYSDKIEAQKKLVNAINCALKNAAITEKQALKNELDIAESTLRTLEKTEKILMSIITQPLTKLRRRTVVHVIQCPR